MKKYIISFFILQIAICNSQAINGFGGFGIFQNKEFYNSKFFSISSGFNVRVVKEIIPQIEFSYYFASPYNVTKVNSSGKEFEKIISRITAFNFCLSSKIVFETANEKVKFNLIPKYNYTTTSANAELYNLDESKSIYYNILNESNSRHQQSLGIGIGLEFFISNETLQSIAINLVYNNVNITSSLNEIKLAKFNLQAQQSFGVEIIYSFSILKTFKAKK